jgi:hypothetical protein
MTSIDSFFVGTQPVNIGQAAIVPAASSPASSPNLSLVSRKVSVKGAKNYTLDQVLKNIYQSPFSRRGMNRIFRL